MLTSIQPLDGVNHYDAVGQRHGQPIQEHVLSAMRCYNRDGLQREHTQLDATHQ